MEKKKSTFFLDLHFFGVFHYQVEKVTFLGTSPLDFFFWPGGKGSEEDDETALLRVILWKVEVGLFEIAIVGWFFLLKQDFLTLNILKSMYDYWISIYIQILVGQQKSEIVGTSFGITIYNPFKRKPKNEVHPQS